MIPTVIYVVRLTAEERADLEALIHTGAHRAAATLIHARILLKAEVGAEGPGWDDDRIAEAVECRASTIYRVRQAFVEEGLAYKGRFFHVSPSDRGNEPPFTGIESAGQGSGQPWPMGSG
jgi:hypothetical protein